jgi:hypothetical protein
MYYMHALQESVRQIQLGEPADAPEKRRQGTGLRGGLGLPTVARGISPPINQKLKKVCAEPRGLDRPERDFGAERGLRIIGTEVEVE